MLGEGVSHTWARSLDGNEGARGEVTYDRKIRERDGGFMSIGDG